MWCCSTTYHAPYRVGMHSFVASCFIRKMNHHLQAFINIKKKEIHKGKERLTS